MIVEQGRLVLQRLDQRVDPEAIGLEPFEKAAVGALDRGLGLAPAPGKEAQPAPCGDRRVELAERARGGVAWIGEERLARYLAFGIHRLEIGPLHIDLTTDLEQRRRSVDRQTLRNVADRAQVRRDVLADGAVAPGRAAHQQALLVAQARRQAVDLGLGDRRDRIAFGQIQEAPHAAQELDHLGAFHGVVEGQHRHPVRHLAEVLDRWRADPMRRAVGPDPIGKARLDRLIAPAQPVVLGIGDFGRVLAIVEPVVTRDLGSEEGELRRRLLRAQPLRWDLEGCGPHPGTLAQADWTIRLWAAARAASVIVAPASIRAISSRRPASERGTADTSARPLSRVFSTRQ